MRRSAGKAVHCILESIEACGAAVAGYDFGPMAGVDILQSVSFHEELGSEATQSRVRGSLERFSRTNTSGIRVVCSNKQRLWNLAVKATGKKEHRRHYDQSEDDFVERA
ncbi:hypothetical protein L1887_50331 [Cichorium endivia]|nr:hypothetical protein L1887_50331 [Cichorium endivia]